jgi:hypothetical protein
MTDTKTEIELAHPNWKWVMDFNNSKNYLNCPIFWLNEKIFHNARQTTHYTKEQRIDFVHEILRVWACRTDKKTATRLVEQFENLSFADMHKINPNIFRDNQPMPNWMELEIRRDKESEMKLFSGRWWL